jgi:hypothetical protein
VWIGTDSGELVRADAVLGLACAGGSLDAFCSDSRTVRLAGSACPGDFHVQLLDLLGRARVDDRRILVASRRYEREEGLAAASTGLTARSGWRPAGVPAVRGKLSRDRELRDFVADKLAARWSPEQGQPGAAG